MALNFKETEKIYIIIISFLGLSSFWINLDFFAQSLWDWVLIYMLVGSIILLNFFPKWTHLFILLFYFYMALVLL